MREAISTIIKYGDLVIEERKFIDGNVRDFVVTWKEGDAEGNAHGNHDNFEADLRRLDVEPQGMGCGTAFYNELEDWLMNQGVELITLYSVRSSRRFWFKMGFMPTDDIDEDEFVCGNMYKKV